MAKNIRDIIKDLKTIHNDLKPQSPLRDNINQTISDLEDLDKSSLDKNIDRIKKGGEIITIAMKIIYEFFPKIDP